MPNKNALFLPFIVVLAGHFFVDVMIGIWPIYKTFAQIDLAVAGIIGALGALLGEGMQILFGSLCDRGFRRALIFCGIVAATASAFLVYIDNYFALFVLYLTTCIGSGAFHPSAASLVSDIPTQRKGLLMALFTSAGAFGMAFSQILFMQTHAWFNGHVGWLAAPAIALVAVACLLRKGNLPVTTCSSGHFSPKTYLQFFKHYPLRMLYIYQVSMSAILWGTVFLLPDLLVSRGYPSWIAFGGGHFAFILGSAAMMIPAGYLSDKFGSRRILFLTAAICMLALYLLILFPLMDNVTMLGVLFVLGAGIGTINPVSIALGTKLAPQHKGMVSAFLMGMVWCISEGIGLAGGGLLAANFTSDAPAKALAVLGSVFIVALATAFQLPQNEQEAVFVPVTIK